MGETVLIQQARQGDQAAWVRLVADHQQVVFRLAYLLLGDADEAQDVAQEAFVRAFRWLERFDEERPLRPWLLRITANLSRNQRRSWGRYWAALTRFAQSELPVQDPPDQAQSEAETAGMLWEAVKRLGRADREVITLRYFLELSVEETAEALQVAPGTVKSRLHRGLGRLKGVILRDFPGLREEHVL